jgi:hypothetical protein
MADTLTLRDLLRIRRKYARWLRSLPGYLGSAVGYKYLEDSDTFARDKQGRFKPAVLVFVEKKIEDQKALIKSGHLIPPRLDGPGKLSCATDVVQGTLPTATPTTPALTGAARALQRELHEAPLPIVGGIPLTSGVGTGTAACVVRSTAGENLGQLGVLTNWHVAGLVGNRILRPLPRLQPIGTTTRVVFTAPKRTPDPDDLESFTTADHRVDAGFIALPNGAATRVAAGVHGLGRLGEPHVVNLDSMDLIGRNVISVGQTLGRRRGRIAAYGYEWQPDLDDRAQYATDYLILGERDEAFAAPGDSGKLVVTDDNERIPVALLWGGQRHGFWNAHAQETWSYASALGIVLRELQVELLSNGSTQPRSS